MLANLEINLSYEKKIRLCVLAHNVQTKPYSILQSHTLITLRWFTNGPQTVIVLLKLQSTLLFQPSFDHFYYITITAFYHFHTATLNSFKTNMSSIF